MELKVAIDGFDYFDKLLNDFVSFDFNDYATVISEKQAKELFNADSIYFYDLPLYSHIRRNIGSLRKWL